MENEPRLLELLRVIHARLVEIEENTRPVAPRGSEEELPAWQFVADGKVYWLMADGSVEECGEEIYLSALSKPLARELARLKSEEGS